MVGELRRQELDRHQTIEPHFAREIHHTHSAAANLAIEREAASYCFLKREEERGGCIRHCLLLADRKWQFERTASGQCVPFLEELGSAFSNSPQLIVCQHARRGSSVLTRLQRK